MVKTQPEGQLRTAVPYRANGPTPPMSAALPLLSHELMTPLTVIAGSAHTLSRHADEIDADTSQRMLRNIVDYSERLTHVLQQLLTASSLQLGTVVPQSQRVAVPQLVRKVAARSPVRQGAVIESRVLAHTPDVMADERLLEAALCRLVDNAVRHGRGPVEVGCGRGTRGVCIWVSDHGPGIPWRDQKRVFEGFVRATPGVETGGGLGLGLYVCRELVRRMRGTVALCSRPGLGTTATIELPVWAASSACTAPPARTRTLACGEKEQGHECV